MGVFDYENCTIGGAYTSRKINVSPTGIIFDSLRSYMKQIPGKTMAGNELVREKVLGKGQGKEKAYGGREEEEERRSWHSLACRLLRACSSGHPVTVVWLKDSGQAVTCLDCKYRGETLLEALPKPKLKWHQV
ncbi:hypothetical protein KM043_007039 [Ampulex compressa]|nr:hypothetical protein KM043_007039 [Ampulex compressa]